MWESRVKQGLDRRSVFHSSAVALSAAAILCAAGPAHAEYSVSARSATRAGNAGYTVCYYNEPGLGGNGCSNLFDYSGGHTGTGSVTPAAGNAATSATVATSQTGQDFAAPFSAASSNVSASLVTASLHFLASDNSTPNDGNGSGSSAEISDVLHFTAQGATASTVSAINLTFTVDGTFMPTGSNNNSGVSTEQGDFYGALVLGGHHANFFFKNDSTNAYKTSGAFDQYPYPFDIGSWTHNAAFTSATFTGTYYFTGLSSDVPVTLNANMDCNDGLICDFANTAKLQLSLPTGVTYTSASGVFLTGTGSIGSVPEPASWAMLVVGFAAVGTMARRRRETVAA